MFRVTAAVLATLLTAAACGGGEGAADPMHRPLVVATTSILGDVVEGAFGESVRIEVMITGDRDPHTYRPTPLQTARLRDADLVVANGLGLEEALVSILEAAADDGVRVIELGDFVDPISLASGGDAHGGAPDPHFWHDPQRMAVAVTRLGEELARLDPDRAGKWRADAGAYRALLLELDGEIRDMFAAIPPAIRKLITNHDSLRYFADAYGFTIVGTVIPGATTSSEPSASDLAELVATIRQENIGVIFAETTRPAALAEVVAAEAGRDVRVVALYTGSLGEPGTGAETYPGYLRTNAELILQALVP